MYQFVNNSTIKVSVAHEGRVKWSEVKWCDVQRVQHSPSQCADVNKAWDVGVHGWGLAWRWLAQVERVKLWQLRACWQKSLYVWNMFYNVYDKVTQTSWPHHLGNNEVHLSIRAGSNPRPWKAEPVSAWRPALSCLDKVLLWEGGGNYSPILNYD